MPDILAMLFAVLVYFDGVPQQCVVDTGATYTVITERAAAQMGTLSTVVAQAQLYGAGGGTILGQVRYIPNVGTGQIGWSGVSVIVVPNDQLAGLDCVLGLDLLKRQSVVFDWGKRELRAL